MARPRAVPICWGKKNAENDTVSSTLTGSICVNSYYSTGRGRKEKHRWAWGWRTHRDNQKCPKARRLVATSKEIKALEKERCQLIPGRLVTGPAGIPTQAASHGDGQKKRNRPENKGKPHRRTIYMDKYAATEREKVPEASNAPAASRPSASCARGYMRGKPLMAPISLKLGGQQIITHTRRNIRGHCRGPSYRSVFLLPVFVTSDCLLFPGPPCVTSSLPVPTLGKNHTGTTMHGGRNKPPRSVFRSPNPRFLCSHARNTNK